MAEKRYSCDDCEKQFVRPEHLYRHRLNHRPKRIYTCSSCSKTFVRRDLLNRHEKRHEQGMPAHGRRTSSIISSPVDGHGSVEQSPVPPPPPVQRPPSHLGPTTVPQSFPIHSNQQPETTHLFFDSSTDVQGVREDLDWLFSNGNVPEQQRSEAYHQAQAPWTTPAPISLSPSSTNSFQSGDAHVPPPNEWGEVRAHVLSALDLILPPPVLQSSFFEPESLQAFYNIYFHNYNAHFPILHEPTFNPQEAPPLLMVAILTLGATLSPDESHFQTAERIHDSLRWLIFSSEAFSPPAPLWCLQALLLAQAQEKMFSSRKHHEMAHIFHGAIITLMRRGSSYTSGRAVSSDSSSLEKAWRSWIDRELGLRAAFFAFIMDAQHASIFGHTPALSVSDLRLPLPCADRLWEASTASRWKREQARPEEMPEFLPTLRAVLARAPLPSTFCAFSRFIILHGLFSLAKHMEAREITSIDVGTNKLSLEDNRSTYSTNSESPDSWRETLDRAIETWSFSLMSQEPSLCLEAARTLHRIAHIVLHVNLIDFHVLAGALTGAPSLTGNEITSAEYARSKSRIIEWTKKPIARRTLSHCFMMVQETIFSRHQYQAAEDNIALRPWSLYNATLIIWSWGMLTQGKSTMPILPAEEYIIHMMSSLRGAQGSCQNLPGANRTAGLVGSVKRSLTNCRWELLQEAHLTLGKLLDVDEVMVGGAGGMMQGQGQQQVQQQYPSGVANTDGHTPAPQQQQQQQQYGGQDHGGPGLGHGQFAGQQMPTGSHGRGHDHDHARVQQPNGGQTPQSGGGHFVHGHPQTQIINGQEQHGHGVALGHGQPHQQHMQVHYRN